MASLKHNALLFAMLMSLASCGGGGGDETTGGSTGGTPPVTTPPVTTPTVADTRYIVIPEEQNVITDLHFAKWNSPGSSLPTQKITWHSTDYGTVISYDLNSISNQLSDSDLLQFSVKIQGVERAVSVPFNALKSTKLAVQLNTQTAMLSDYILPASSDQQTKMLRAVGMMDTNQDQKVSVADIAFYDHVYFKSSPISNNTQTYIFADNTSSTDWIDYFNMRIADSSNIAPFRELSTNPQKSTITLVDGSADLSGIAEMRYELSCQSPDLDKAWSQATIDPVEVPANCSLYYSACVEVNECGIVHEIYFSNQWATTQHEMASSTRLGQSADLDLLKKDPVFMQKYAEIQSRQEEVALIQLMSCQLIRHSGSFCSY